MREIQNKSVYPVTVNGTRTHVRLTDRDARAAGLLVDKDAGTADKAAPAKKKAPARPVKDAPQA